jgi:diguanylate cyclase (GGDEF)-like protein/PAS domain S-box-containing protein
MTASNPAPDGPEYRANLAAALQHCANEPIHQIGSIQDGGVLLAFDVADWTLRVVSSNCALLFTQPANALLGQSIDTLLGAASAQKLREMVAQQQLPGAAIGSISLQREGVTFSLDVQVYRTEAHVVVEVEHQPAARGDVFHELFIPIRDALWRLDAEQDLTCYAYAVVDQVRLLTGFDRVMMYRFDSNWDGEVIAESRQDTLDSYLGNRFPASDIPAQARRLYTRNLVRMIADVDAIPVPLVPSANDSTAVDLSFSWLRSLSPVHVAYLRNMGVQASLSISLVQNDRLWGLIACHHMTAKFVPLRERELDEFIGRVVSLKLIHMDAQERSAINARIREVLFALTSGIRGAQDLDAVINSYRQELLGIVRADGAIVSLGGVHHRIGEVPNEKIIEHLVAMLRDMNPAPVFHTEHLADLGIEFAEIEDKTSGMLVAPLDHQARDFVMWFRPSILRTLRWAGEPNKLVLAADGVQRISPRKSFATWSQTYRDKSMPWTQVELDAANSLALALVEVLAQRALRSKDESFRLLAENSTDMIASIDLGGRFRFVSPAGFELFGIPAGDMIGQPVENFIHADDWPMLQRALQNLTEEGSAVTIMSRPRGRIGNILWIEATIKRTCGPSGQDELVMNARDVTQRHTYQLAIEDVHRRNSRILDAAGDGLISLDHNGSVVYANEVALRLIARESGEIIGKHCCQVLVGADENGKPVDPTNCPFIATLDDGESRQGQLALVRLDGQAGKQTSYICTSLREAEGNSGCVVVLTESRPGRTQEQTRSTDVILEQALEAVMVTDTAGRITSVNRAFSEITGYTQTEAIGQTPRLLKSGVHTPHFYEDFWKALDTHNRWVGEIWNRRKNGEIYPQWGSVTAVLDHAGKARNYVAVFSDISKAKQAEEKLYYLANHDSLTGLPNRMSFSEQLDRSIERAKRSRASISIVYVDLDRFKIINDTLGHAVGDLYLKKLAERMQSALRRQDTLARWGGDEFIIALEDAGSQTVVAETVTRLLRKLAEPIYTEGQELIPTASVGISSYPADGVLAADLIKAADTAMYRAKDLGRNRFEFFTEQMKSEQDEKFAFAGEIRRALAMGEFCLYYQPQVDARNGAVIGVEALARWQHPLRGVLGPQHFIPLAEEIGLIGELGDWVLREACRQMRVWRDQGVSVPRVAVNVAPAQFQESFIASVRDALHDSGIPPDSLEIEITEGALAAGETVRNLFIRLREMGVQLSVDDFGTGYSSLSHLKHFPITSFKIDKSFIDGVPDDAVDKAIVRAILALGSSLHVEVVAEGVETAEQAVFLQTAGVNIIQGYFYGYPMPPVGLGEFLLNYRPPVLASNGTEPAQKNLES